MDVMKFARLQSRTRSGFVGYLFLLGSGKGCGLWLWHSLDFFLIFFFYIITHTHLLKINCCLLNLSPETKILTCRGQVTVKIDKIYPNQIFTISMHTSVWWISINVYSSSSGNEKSDVLRTDNSVKDWRNLLISNPQPDLHSINTHTTFGEISLTFAQVIIRKRKWWRTDGRTTDGWTEEHRRPTWNHITQPLSCGGV